MSGDFHSFPCNVERMAYMTVALWTIVWFVLAVLLYHYVFNPQMVITPKSKLVDKCPDRWTYNATTKLCTPNYTTKCVPFDPDKVPTVGQKCNIARTCGTNWSNVCF